MHRFFVQPNDTESPLIQLGEREAHHAFHVLRLKAGDEVVALDGKGTEFSGRIEHASKRSVSIHVLERKTAPPLPCRITLVQAITKGKSMETILQKATELGAARIVPLLAERSVAHPDRESSQSKMEKWQWIAIDAIKQSGQPWLPEVLLPISPAEYLKTGGRSDLELFGALDGGAEHPRLPMQRYLQQHGKKPETVAVWIGPEGDFSPAETNSFRAAGILPITLGPLILRSDTAALYCLSILNYELRSPL